MRDQWNASEYDIHAGFVSQLAQELLDDLVACQGEKILDLGCGNGELALILQQQGCIVTGIDSSISQVNAARENGVEVCLLKAEEMEFTSYFDAVYSNAAMHWMLRQEEVIDRVFNSLIPGGRFVVEMGGSGNIATIYQALTKRLAAMGIDFRTLDPWVFPSVEEHKTRLEQAGFIVNKCSLRERPTVLPTDVKGWFKVFGTSILPEFSSERLEKLIDELVEDCRLQMFDNSGRWTVDYVRLNSIAIRPK